MYVRSISHIVTANQDTRPDTAPNQRMDSSVDVCLESFMHHMFVNPEGTMVDSHNGHAFLGGLFDPGPRKYI